MTDPASPLRYLADGFFQIAYVVPDIDAAIGYFTAKMGTPRFFVMRDAAVRDQTYKGAAADIHSSVAFGYAGTMQLEIIQPLSGTSTYSAFLEERPGGGLHHVGVRVDDYEKAVRDVSGEGYPVLQTGHFGSATVFGYADTRSALGHYTELVQLDAEVTALFDRVRRQDF